MVFLFKIQLEGVTKPPVWRQIAVPADFTFLQFHKVIQAAFGWEDFHLFAFQNTEWNSSLRIDLPTDNPLFGPDLNAGAMNASTTTLSDIFNGGFRKLLYIYDFVDNWIHHITLESTDEGEQKKAVCLSGQGACPPDEIGGPHGYKGFKDLFETRADSAPADNFRTWLGMDDGEVWDAERFDVKKVNRLIKKI